MVNGLKWGEVVFEVLHTPGHTPEHSGFLLVDRSRGETPCVFLSGGSLLVGDVARPDLLGNREETQRHAAGLCRTLQEKILKLPDHVEVYPTHVSGSLCGGSISSRLSTTLRAQDEQTLGGAQLRNEFRRELLKAENLPAVPSYWKRMRTMNQQGPALLGTLAEPPALPADEFERLASEDANTGLSLSGSVRRSHSRSYQRRSRLIICDLGRHRATRRRIDVLVLDSKRDLWEVCWQLLRIGYDLPKGWLSGGMMAWRTAARPLEILPQSTVWDLHRRMEENPQLLILDVRQPGGMERESHRGRSAHYRSRAAEPD
jgi:hydroxyacylglutathione hydrolase